MTKKKENQTLTEDVLSALSRSKVMEIKDLFEKKGIKEFLSNQELKTTAQVLLQNNLNVCKASKQIFMHRNTLLYRVAKIKKQTSFDMKNFDDAMSIKTLLILFELYGN